MTIKEQIRTYLREKLLYVDEGFDYSDDTSFISEGLIDSTGIMELVSFVRSTFAIQVDQKDLTPDNFDSINKIANFIHTKIEKESLVLR